MSSSRHRLFHSLVTAGATLTTGAGPLAVLTANVVVAGQAS
jgi:hypothetical protein